MRVTILAVPLLLTLLSAVPARSAEVYMAVSPGLFPCASAIATPGSVVELHVFINSPEGYTGAAFRVGTPECPGVSLLDWSTPYLSIGDPESGIGFATGECTQGEIKLLTLRYLVAGEVDCCEIPLLPHPDPLYSALGDVMVVDCSFFERPAYVSRRGFVSTNPEGCAGTSELPRDPYPPDGATGVPVTFSWPGWDIDVAHLVCPVMCYPELYRLHFGTDPDPPLVYSYMNREPDLGPLEPGTTYYWRIVVINCGFLPESPVWSFTTENATPAESKTWGAVKALYR